MRTRISVAPLFVFLAGTYGLLAQAPPQQPYGEDGILQGQAVGDSQDQVEEDRRHGVARISLLNGDVSVRRGDSGDYVAAAINAPLLALDALQTGAASRAEIQFDIANRVRFGKDTEARLAQIAADRYVVQIARGTLTLAVLDDGGAQGEIATTSVAIRPTMRGAYRVSVFPDGTTQITVRTGSLEVYSPRGTETLGPGQTMLAKGAVENPEFQIVAAIPLDEWDQFNERRDRELQGSQSYNYVSRDIAGAEELDSYGHWGNDPQYGEVWTPRVAPDWAPYRLGRWSYEDYYGWTWVSADPWGWAPYHYGSWFRGSYGWSWYPGPRYGRYSYRPALVAFFGFGGGGAGFGNGWNFGNVGWVPLAPFERYHRWYGRGVYGSGSFGRGGSILSNANIGGLYRNARASNGVTALNSRDFATGHFGRYASPGSRELQQAGAVRGNIPFTPNSNHYRFNDRQTSVQPRANFGQTRFAAAGNSGNTFGARSQTIESQHFGSFSRQQSTVAAQPSQNRGTNGSNWDRFGNPGRTTPSDQQFGRGNTASQGNSRPNWQRFGDPGSSPQQSRGSVSEGIGQYRQQNSSSFGRNGGSIQVAPPVVRERSMSQPSYNRPSYNQPRFSQPSYSRPSYNQPSYNRPSSNPGQRSNREFSRPSGSNSPQQGGHANSGHDGGSHRR